MKMFSAFLFANVFFALMLATTPLYAAQLNTKSTLVDTTPPNLVPSPAPETKFAPAIEDLPLMPDLNPVPDEDTMFVVPSAGRIAQSTAEGPVDIDDVYKFYRKSLPHLGWKVVDARTYLRDGEQLRIDAHANGKVTTVRFSVKPN
jgi:hypothetical protein